MIRGLVIVLLCGSCNLLLGLKEFEHDAAVQDAALPARCSAVSMLGDSFDTDDLKDRWPGSAVVSVANGHAVLTPAEKDYSILTSQAYYDFREGEIALTIDDDGATVPGDVVNVALYSTRASYGLLIQRTQGILLFSRNENGTVTTFGSSSYDPAAPTHVRVTHHGATTSFDTSPDGVAWTTATSMDGLDYVDFVRLDVSAYRAMGAPAYSAYIEDINGGMPSGAACKSSTLRDTFDGPGFAESLWVPVAYGGTLGITAGRLELGAPAGADLNVLLASSTIYDLTDDQVVFEVPEMLDPTTINNLSFTASVRTLSGNTAAFYIGEDGSNQLVEVKYIPQQVAAGAQTYVRANTRWFRFRHAQNQLHWDSSDGVTWLPLTTANDVAGLDRAVVAFGINGMPVAARTVQIDNVGVPF